MHIVSVGVLSSDILFKTSNIKNNADSSHTAYFRYFIKPL